MIIPGIIASSVNISSTAFESIASATPTSGTSVTFSSIPGSYQHLQVRCNTILTSSGGGLYVQFNSDTSTNSYVSHTLYGNGTTVTATGWASGFFSPGQIFFYGFGPGNVTTQPNVSILDIHDYASTTKNKTTRSFGGADNNSTGGHVAVASGLWLSTSAITSLTINSDSAFISGTTFALYGIKGA